MFGLLIMCEIKFRFWIWSLIWNGILKIIDLGWFWMSLKTSMFGYPSDSWGSCLGLYVGPTQPTQAHNWCNSHNVKNRSHGWHLFLSCMCFLVETRLYPPACNRPGYVTSGRRSNCAIMLLTQLPWQRVTSYDARTIDVIFWCRNLHSHRLITVFAARQQLERYVDRCIDRRQNGRWYITRQRVNENIILIIL